MESLVFLTGPWLRQVQRAFRAKHWPLSMELWAHDDLAQPMPLSHSGCWPGACWTLALQSCCIWLIVVPLAWKLLYALPCSCSSTWVLPPPGSCADTGLLFTSQLGKVPLSLHPLVSLTALDALLWHCWLMFLFPPLRSTYSIFSPHLLGLFEFLSHEIFP